MPWPTTKRGRILTPTLTSPDSYNTVPTAFGQVPILDANLFNNRGGFFFFGGRDTGPAVPVSTVRLIINFGDVLAGSRHDSTAIEHHACDWGIICIGIMNCTCPEVPDLYGLAVYC